MQSRPTLETILSHRSIRKFTKQPLSEEIVETLVNAGRAASSSNHLQCVSIIRITDHHIRQQIAELSGMAYVASCAEFLLFCIDFHKHQQLNPTSQLDWAEVTLIGAVDTGIMAQNVLLAAESLGLGGVYIGALRNQIEAVSELVKLPKHCAPLVALCLGHPAQDPMLKPRLPQSAMCYENQYRELDPAIIDDYNQTLSDYYQQRSGQEMIWQDSIKKSLDKPVRPHILPYLQKQGLLKR